jgi:hypothetical protein
MAWPIRMINSKANANNLVYAKLDQSEYKKPKGIPIGLVYTKKTTNQIANIQGYFA